MKTPSTLKVDSIQFLRAVAVVLVVYVHILDSSVFANPQQKNFYYLENWGAIGLDLFFVISGFIMTIIAPNYTENKNWKDFLVKRALRIIPLYWLLSVFSVVMSVAKGATFTGEKILKTLLFIPFFDGEAFVFPIIPVGWSLSLEIYFYALIAALLVFSNKEHIYKNLITLLMVLVVAGYLFKPTHQLLKFLTSPLLLEFALGIVAGIIFKRANLIENINSKRYLKTGIIASTIMGLGLMILSIFTGFSNVADAAVVSDNPSIAAFRTFVWGLPCAIFLTGFVLLENLYQIKTPRIFIMLGDASYSCYLLHTTVLIPICMKIFKLSGIGNGDMYIFISLLVVSLGSIVFYQYGERNLNTFIYNRYIVKRNIQLRLTYTKPAFFVTRVTSRFKKGAKAIDSPLV